MRHNLILASALLWVSVLPAQVAVTSRPTLPSGQPSPAPLTRVGLSTHRRLQEMPATRSPSNPHPQPNFARVTSAAPGDVPDGLPEGATCVSGRVDRVSRSLELQASRLADEVVIGGTKLCTTCDSKAPLFREVVDKLEAAQLDKLEVDVCYDAFGTLNYLRMRQP